MVKEVLVGDYLSEQMIEAGANLLRQLDQLGLQIDAALWFYNADAIRWKLVLAMPETSLKGPRQAYSRLQAALQTMEAPIVALQHITAVDSDAPLILSLKSILRSGIDVAGYRLTRAVIGGMYIDDAYIYRLERNEGEKKVHTSVSTNKPPSAKRTPTRPRAHVNNRP